MEAYDKDGEPMFFKRKSDGMYLRRIHVPEDQDQWVAEDYVRVPKEEHDAYVGLNFHHKYRAAELVCSGIVAWNQSHSK